MRFEMQFGRKSSHDGRLPSFWSPVLARDRKAWFKMAFLLFVLLVAIVWGVLCIYWGALHSLQFNLDVATVAIVDLDGGQIGSAIQAAGQQARSAMPKMSLGYVSPSLNEYPTEEAVRKGLKNEDFWFAIVAVPGATERMNNALTNGNSSYQPTEALKVYYEQGRNALIISQQILPELNMFLKQFVAQFTLTKQSSLLQENQGNAAALANQVRIPIPASYTLVNEAPYLPTTVEAATEIGSIYIIITAFISVLYYEQVFRQLLGKISTGKLIVIRMLTLPVLFLMLAAFYLLLSVCWQVPFANHFGTSGYVLYWLLNWVAMISFGLTVSNVNDVVGQPFTSVFFVFWVVSNIATGFFPIEFLSNFYRWGLAWPFRHLLTGSKAIILGTKNVLGLNFGVIIAWVAVGLALQPFTILIWIRRNKSLKESNRKDVLQRTKSTHESQSSASD